MLKLILTDIISYNSLHGKKIKHKNLIIYKLKITLLLLAHYKFKFQEFLKAIFYMFLWSLSF